MNLSQWRRHGEHLAGILIILVIVLGSRMITTRASTYVNKTTSSSTKDLVAAQVDFQPMPDSSPEATFDLSNVPILQNNSISPALNPYTYEPKLPEHNFQTYIVERGDTPNGIADKFGLKPETLLGGNPFLSEESTALQTGVELVILPVDGVLHDVSTGETLEGLAQQYGVPIEHIIAYEPNNLEFPYRLERDTQILVPGAVRELFIWNPPQLTVASGRTSSEGRGLAPAIQGTGTFIWPIISRSMTQNYWYGHPAIDVALPEGSAVVASDTGTVTFAGWNIFGYGNLIVVNHGNGYETFYAHLSGINVMPGQIVYQGNVIGATGNTGRSSGPHIHFEVRSNGFQDNPCRYVGC